MYLTAHISRIYSLDWSFHDKDQLVTSAQDCFVKFFNVQGWLAKKCSFYFKTHKNFILVDSQQASKPLSTLKTAVPVWKAMYTPFGDG